MAAALETRRLPAHTRGARRDGGLTLGQRLELARRSARATGGADCPVCGDHMHRDGDVATCRGCGSRLS